MPGFNSDRGTGYPVPPYAMTVNPGSGNDQTQGYKAGSIAVNINTGQSWVARSVATGAAIWDLISSSPFPTKQAGRWYQPDLITLGAPGAIATNTLLCVPVIFSQRFTIDQVAINLGATAASSTGTFGIYASDPGPTGPSGPALATAGFNTAIGGAVGAALSASVQVEPGLVYWFAFQCTSGTPTFSLESTSHGDYVQRIGAKTIATAVPTAGGGSSAIIEVAGQSANVMPTLGGTGTETNANAVLVAYHIASVP